MYPYFHIPSAPAPTLSASERTMTNRPDQQLLDLLIEALIAEREDYTSYLLLSQSAPRRAQALLRAIAADENRHAQYLENLYRQLTGQSPDQPAPAVGTGAGEPVVAQPPIQPRTTGTSQSMTGTNMRTTTGASQSMTGTTTSQGTTGSSTSATTEANTRMLPQPPGSGNYEPYTLENLSGHLQDEWEGARNYRQLYLSFLNREIRDNFLEMFTDEMLHAQALQYLISTLLV